MSHTRRSLHMKSYFWKLDIRKNKISIIFNGENFFSRLNVFCFSRHFSLFSNENGRNEGSPGWRRAPRSTRSSLCERRAFLRVAVAQSNVNKEKFSSFTRTVSLFHLNFLHTYRHTMGCMTFAGKKTGSSINTTGHLEGKHMKL